jgi:hypothetical protein
MRGMRNIPCVVLQVPLGSLNSISKWLTSGLASREAPLSYVAFLISFCVVSPKSFHRVTPSPAISVAFSFFLRPDHSLQTISLSTTPGNHPPAPCNRFFKTLVDLLRSRLDVEAKFREGLLLREKSSWVCGFCLRSRVSSLRVAARGASLEGELLTMMREAPLQGVVGGGGEGGDWAEEKGSEEDEEEEGVTQRR